MTTLKGLLATAVALVVCPCHLPLTLPLALGLLGGSAVGLWLAQNTWLVWLAATGLFIGFLGLGFYWLTKPEETSCPAPGAHRRIRVSQE